MKEVTAEDILWEQNPMGCMISLIQNGRIYVHPDMLREAQKIADERNAKAFA